jgi:hypothetical protein
LNENNLNKFALDLAKKIQSVRGGLPLSAAMGVVNYKLSSIAVQLHIRADTMSGYSPAVANTYSLMLLKSGAGKNSSLGLADRFFFGDAYSAIRDEVYPFYKKKAEKKLEESKVDRVIHSWVQSISNSTLSGMFAYAESYTLCGVGGLNIEVDEIGNAVTSKAELFETLLTPYDNGEFAPVAKRTDSNAMDIRGLPVNLFCFGNKVRLINGDITENKFTQLLDEGYGRRFIFIDDNSDSKEMTPQELLQEMKASNELQKNSGDVRARIRGVVSKENFKRVFELDDDAMLEFATIKVNGMKYISENKGLDDAVIADYSERHFKTVKLACVYSLFDGNDVVTGRNILEAFEIVEESTEVLKKLRKSKPLHVRLLEKMLHESEPITSQHMLEYPFINSGWTKKILEYVELAKQYAVSHGYEWDEVTKGGVTYYSVVESDDKMIIEASELF